MTGHPEPAPSGSSPIAEARFAGPGRTASIALAALFSLTLLATTAAPASAGDPVRPTPAVAADVTNEPWQEVSRLEPTPPADHHAQPGDRSKPAPPADLEPAPPPPGAVPPPLSLNLYKAAGFRYQDPNYYACTATSVMNMLNFIYIGGTGGSGFKWTTKLGSAARDSILAWERTHDTLAGGNGSDPHGWRNALNYYGYGSAYLYAGSRIYEDLAFTSYEKAIKSAVRQLIRHRKPVGLAAWRGQHAQMITGYDGLKGDPFAVDSAGRYTNAFTIDALYLTDPLQSSAVVNKRITYTTLGTTTNTRIRFQPYYETDSPYDDPYTAGTVRARDEWYGRWVIVAPIR